MNCFFEPWGFQWRPRHVGLSANPALPGTVTCKGALVGFIPGVNLVVGDATAGLDLSRLSGQDDFIGLEQWDVGTVPDGAGSGSIWGDWHHSYRLASHSN